MLVTSASPFISQAAAAAPAPNETSEGSAAASGDNPASDSQTKPASLWPAAPEIAADGAVVMDADTGFLLYDHNSADAFYPASTTKLMTALLALEQGNLSDMVTCSRDAVFSIGWDSSRIGLDVYESISLEEALYAILLASANEVSYAVAEYIGKSYSNFITMMNERAAELGCINTQFVNAHGLDDPNHYSCAYDLALIMRQCIKYPVFTRISGSKNHTIPETNKNVARPIANTHLILRNTLKYDGVFAGKTGHTSIAGNCLVTCCERDGLRLICVVMHEPSQEDAYKDTMALLDYSYNNFKTTIIDPSQTSGTNAFSFMFEGIPTIISNISTPLSIRSSSIILPSTVSPSELDTSVQFTELTELKPGDNEIGFVVYSLEGHYLGESPIIYHSTSYKDLLNTPTPTPEPKKELQIAEDGTVVSVKEELPESKRSLFDDPRPLVISVIITLVLIFVGHYLVLIELPYLLHKHRKHRKTRYN